MNERFECQKTERIKRFEEENICDKKKIEILSRYINLLIEKLNILCEESIGNGDNEVVNIPNEIVNLAYKIQVVLELKKDYKLTE